MKYTVATGLLLLGSAVAAPGGWGNGKRPCSPAEIALATGIHLNINAQFGEFNSTKKIEELEQAHPDGPNTAIYEAIGGLQADVQAGMNIRLFNQQIAPAGNHAIPGLAKYAAAEETEKAQAANLTGTYAIDKPVFEMLKMEIMTGIQLNRNNLADAVCECDFTLVFPPENESGS